MQTFIGGKTSFICNPLENINFNKYILSTPRNDGQGSMPRKKLVVVTGKDTDNRFTVVGN